MSHAHADTIVGREEHGHTHDESMLGHEHAHHESFLTKYFFSQDHKRIGIQFLLSSLVFFVVGGMMAMAIRWHLAYPKENFPMTSMLPAGLVDAAPADATVWKEGYPLEL